MMDVRMRSKDLILTTMVLWMVRVGDTDGDGLDDAFDGILVITLMRKWYCGSVDANDHSA